MHRKDEQTEDDERELSHGVAEVEKCMLLQDAQIITMKEKYIQILGVVVTVVYGAFVVFLYAAEPRSIEEISIKAKSTVENAVTKGQVIAGTYEIDQAKFKEGIVAFRNDNFIAARDSFERADPEKRDPKTQYYIAYS
jgi:hypothetical protein